MATVRICGAFAAAAMLVGCVSVQKVPLTASSGATLRDREITLGVRDKPDFTAFRSSTMALGGGLLAGAITIAEGNRIVAQNLIDDPAAAISRALSANLEQAYQVRPTARTAKVEDDDVAATARQNPGADLILDVRTLAWMFTYFPTAWTRYRILYSARLRLIDVKRSQVVAEGLCKHLPDETPDAPTFDELVADKAARLKRELGIAAERCVRTFATETLAIAQPTFAVAAPLPSVAKVMTQPELNAPTAGLAAFSGTWDGVWAGNRRATLVVEKIEGSTAQLTLSWGAGGRRAQRDAGSDRAAGTFTDDGALRATLADGTQLLYRMGDGQRSLKGEWQREERLLKGVFMRRETP
jgi:hypothetical protein